MLPFRQVNTKGIISTEIKRKLNIPVVLLDEFLYVYVMEIAYTESNIAEIKFFLFLSLGFGINDLLSLARMEFSST